MIQIVQGVNMLSSVKGLGRIELLCGKSQNNLDAFMHNWANPKKFENELSVPSDRHYE